MVARTRGSEESVMWPNGSQYFRNVNDMVSSMFVDRDDFIVLALAAE